MIIKSVRQEVESGLCVGCGVCASVCPYDAIKMTKNSESGTYEPTIGESCKECGLCVEVCFAIGNDPKLSSNIFGNCCTDPTLGAFLNCYVGYACDYKTRYSSTSGAIVTTLLLYLLKRKIVNGVLVTKMDEMRPLETKSFIAKTNWEVVSAAGSKYCPVSIDVALKHIMGEDGHFAVVGLPCHIYGIRKAEKLYPKLEEKISFHIGLFCGGTASFLMTEYLLKKLKVRKELIRRIKYRGMGWPGKMLIELKGEHANKNRKVISPYPHFIQSLFLPYGCTSCSDGFNKFADIACGDAWLPEYRGDNIGTSLIVTRNEVGEQLIKSAYEEGEIQIKNIDCERVKQSQKSMIRLKTHDRTASIQLLRTLGKPQPNCVNINVSSSQPALANYAHSVLLCLLRFVASKRYLWNLLDAFYVLQQAGRLKLVANMFASKLQIL